MISSVELSLSSSFYFKNYPPYKFPYCPCIIGLLHHCLHHCPCIIGLLHHYIITLNYYRAFLTSLLSSFVVVGHYTLSPFVVVGHYALSRISFCRRSATCFYFVGLYLHVVLFVCHPYFHKLLSLLHSFIAAGKPHSADFVDEFQ